MKQKYAAISAMRHDAGSREWLRENLHSGMEPRAGASSRWMKHIAEFRHGGKCECGVLVSRGRKYCDVIDASGKELHIRCDHVIDISSLSVDISHPRHAVMTDIRNISAERDRLSDCIDVYELWDTVSVSTKKSWSLMELTELWFGREAGSNAISAMARTLQDSVAFTRQGETYTPGTEQSVAESRARNAEQVAREQGLQETALWLRQMVDGSTQSERPDNIGYAVELLAGKAIYGVDYEKIADANRLVSMAHFHSREAIIDALVSIGYWDRHINLDLLKHGLTADFPEKVLEEEHDLFWRYEVEHFPLWRLQQVFLPENPALRGEVAFSIGRNDNGCVAAVHIACPSLAVRFGGAAMSEALARGRALLLPDRPISLFPNSISSRTALVGTGLRPCLTLRLEIGADWRVRDFSFHLTRLRLPASREDTGAIKEHSRRGQLLRIARQLRAERLANGAVLFPEDRVDVVVSGGVPSIRVTSSDDPGRVIEEEFTILANSLAGALLFSGDIPAIYRSEPRRVSGDVSPAAASDLVNSYRKKRSMPRASLGTELRPHFGLGLMIYVPITEPLRRFPDILMHEQILSLLQGGGPPFNEQQLHDGLLAGAYTRELAPEIERNARLYWLLSYLRQLPDNETTGTVLDLHLDDVLVELDHVHVRAYCQLRGGMRLLPGCRVRLRLTQITPRDGVVRGMVLEVC